MTGPPETTIVARRCRTQRAYPPRRPLQTDGTQQVFASGFLRDLQRELDKGLRALQANRTEDVLFILERLERDVRDQIRWEQQA